MKKEAQHKKQEARSMKYYILFPASCFLLFVSFFFLASYAHDYNIELKSKFKKVKLSNEAIQTLGIKTKKIKEEITGDVIKTTGQIEEIPKNRFDINSPVQGKVTSILVDLGDLVKAGQELATLQSTEITKLQSEVKQFSSELELAKSNYEREKSLFEKGISAKKDFDASKAQLASKEAQLKAAESNLKILAQQTEITHESSHEQGTFFIKSQKTGIIVERNITIGQIINPNQIIFRGVDLSNVWANADIYEKDTSKILPEQIVYVTLDGNPDIKFEGKLTYIGSLINKETRTLPVKATLQNNPGTMNGTPLRPGAFIQMEIHTGKKRKSIVIPRTALVEIDNENTETNHKHTIYLQEGNSFVPRKIKVEPHDSNTVEVLSGLVPGEIIVTEGAYQLQYGKGEKEYKGYQNLNVVALIFMISVALLLFFIFLIKKKKIRQ